MHILLLRHGDALETSNDALRALSPAGRDQAKLAGTILQSLSLIPDLILASPILRAVQTAKIVADTLGVNKIQTTEYLTSGSDHRQIFKQLNELSPKKVLLVGHEPHLSLMVSLLIAGNRTAQMEMRKGMLVLCDSGEPVAPSSGILRWILPPEVSARIRG